MNNNKLEIIKKVEYPNKAIILKYEGEDDQKFLVSDEKGACYSIEKNRSIPKPFIDKPPKPLTPVFRLLIIAFVGLAPAGLGALVFAPLAALWSLLIFLTYPLNRADRIRLVIAWGIIIALLGLAILLNALFMARLAHS